ncbi:hypothetical protein [Nonomuraea fuscirosea]|nr:hypothetical protein [Nonomuraea fuscirosea]
MPSIGDAARRISMHHADTVGGSGSGKLAWLGGSGFATVAAGVGESGGTVYFAMEAALPTE